MADYGLKYVAHELRESPSRIENMLKGTARIDYSLRNRVSRLYNNDYEKFAKEIMRRHYEFVKKGRDDYGREPHPTSDVAKWLQDFKKKKKALDKRRVEGEEISSADYRDLVGYIHAFGIRFRGITWPGSM